MRRQSEFERREKKIEKTRAVYEDSIKKQGRLFDTSGKEYDDRVGHLCNINWKNVPLSLALSHGAPKHILTKALESNEDKNETISQALIQAIKKNDIQTVKLFALHRYTIPELELEKFCKILMQGNNKKIINAILDHFDREKYIKPNLWQIILDLGIEYDCAEQILRKLDKMCQMRNIPTSRIHDFYTSLQHYNCNNERERLKPWSCFKQVHKTNITEPLNPQIDLEDVLPIILNLIINPTGRDESDSVTREINTVLVVLVDKLKESGVLWECIPTLVGSGREQTRCIPDEYDYVLKFIEMVKHLDVSYNRINYEGKITIKSLLPTDIHKEELEFLEKENMIDNERFYDRLLQKLNSNKQAVIEGCRDQDIDIVDISFKKGRSFLFMTITRRDDPFKINVDLVPAFPFKDKIELPYHYHHFGTIERHYVTIKSEFAKSKYNISFSEIEIKIMEQLPKDVKMAYKLAKALRNCYIVKRVIRKLVNLGIVCNLEDLISSYMLKTCVLWITRKGVRYHDNCLGYCIDIYKQLQEFVEQGEILNFFLQGVEGISLPRTLFVCHRQKKDPRLACCRQKEAILLVVKEILSVIERHSEQIRKGNLPNIDHSHVIDIPTPKIKMYKKIRSRQSNAAQSEENIFIPNGLSSDSSIDLEQHMAPSCRKLPTHGSETRRINNKLDTDIELASLNSSDGPIINENTTLL